MNHPLKILLLMIVPVAFSIRVCAQSKQELEIPEIVIGTTSPELIRGQKEQVAWFEAQTSLKLVSDTVNRNAPDFPEVISILDSPMLEPPKSCFSPCFGTALAPAFGPSGRFAAASKAMEKSNWERAIKLLTPIALKTHPETPKALYFIGYCKQQSGDFPGAANAYEMLRRNYPSDMFSEYAGYSLGWIYLQNNNLEKAIEVIDWFKQSYPASSLTPYARYLKAATQYAHKDYQGALDSLEGIVAGYPMFPYLPLVQFWIAENLFFTGQLESAMNNYNLYLQNFPTGDRAPDALYGLSFCYLSQQQYSRSLETLQKLISTFPHHRLRTEGAYQAAKISSMLQKKEDAIRYFNEVITASDARESMRMASRAWLEFESQNFDSARDLFSRFAEKYPADPQKNEMLFMAGVSGYQQRQYKESVTIFIDLADNTTGPLVSSALANAGLCHLKLNNPERAYECFSRAMSQGVAEENKPIYTIYTADTLYRLNKYTESLEMFQAGLKPNLPDSYQAEIIRGIAWNYYSLKSWKEAARYFGEFADKFRKSKFRPEALLRQAESFFNLSEYDSARQKFTDLIKLYPVHPEALEARLLIARIDWVNEEYDSARKSLEETLKYAKSAQDRQRIRITSGDLERDLGQFERAVELYDLAFKDDPTNPKAPEALLKKGDGFYNMERYSESADVYKKLIELFPQAPESITAQYSIGLTYFQQNKLEDYIRECIQTADRYPGSIQGALSLNGAAEMLIEQTRYKEAITLLERLISEYGDVYDEQQLRLRLAQSLEKSGDTDRAQKEYSTLIERHPHGLYSADAALALGTIALAASDTKAASEHYEFVLNQFPHHPRIPEALLKLAELDQHKGDLNSAQKHLERIIEQYPDNQHIINSKCELASIFVRNKKCDQARELLQEISVSQEPEIAAQGIYLQGLCLEEAGKPNEALTMYLKVSYLYGSQRHEAFKSLMRAGEILIDQKKIQEAKRILEKAQSLASTEAETKLAADKLKQIH